jgi:hypothetical protein
MICGISRPKVSGVVALCAGALWFVAPGQAATIKPYRVPKDKPSAPHAHGGAAQAPRQGVSWTVPAGWEEVPAGQMRLGSFKVKGADASQADVSVIPLPGMAGGDLENVNRWRGQVGLEPVKEEDFAKLGEKLQIGGEPAALYDLAGQAPGAPGKTRILAAIQRREGVVFFYKMTGGDKLVAEQKPAFVSFLKSVRFDAAAAGPGALPPSHPPLGGADAAQAGGQPALPPSHPPMDNLAPGKEGGTAALPPDHPPIGGTGKGSAGAEPALPPSHPPLGGAAGQTAHADSSQRPAWKVPAGWQEQPPGQMQMARFLAAGQDNTKAEASVAVIPGDGGGPLANVNRWRRQIGLGPIEAGELAKATESVAMGNATALVLDVASSDSKRRLVAVSVPRGDETWFYKLLGDTEVVAREKRALIDFAQSVK